MIFCSRLISLLTEFPCLNSISYMWPVPNKPMVFVHIPALQEYSGTGKSLLNMAEAHFIARLVANMICLYQRGGPRLSPEQIGVISFYNGQIAHLRRQLEHHPDVGGLAEVLETCITLSIGLSVCFRGDCSFFLLFVWPACLFAVFLHSLSDWSVLLLLTLSCLSVCLFPV